MNAILLSWDKNVLLIFEGIFLIKNSIHKFGRRRD